MSLVRVKLADGSRATVSEEVADIHDLERVMDSDGKPVAATDARGVALDPQPARTVDEAYESMTPAEKGAATRARKKAEAEAREVAEAQNAQARAEAEALAAAAQDAAENPQASTDAGENSTEETR